jgi:hypothetical protein
VVAEWPEWPHRVSCGEHVAFDPIAVFSRKALAEQGPMGSETALRHAVVNGAMSWLPDRRWRLAGESRGYADFLHGHPGAELESGHELQSLELHRRQGHWQMASYSQQCFLWSLRGGRAASTWFLAASQDPLTAETRRIRVDVGARCVKEENPAALAEKPEFREVSGKLVMTIWLRSEHFRGLRACEEGLPPGPPLTVELPEPLGNRELVDGGAYPPWPAMATPRSHVIAG